MTAKGDRKKFFKNLRSQGCRIEMTGGDHFAIIGPDGRRLTTCPSSPSDWRSIRNLRARLRQEGLTV